MAIRPTLIQRRTGFAKLNKPTWTDTGILNRGAEEKTCERIAGEEGHQSTHHEDEAAGVLNLTGCKF